MLRPACVLPRLAGRVPATKYVGQQYRSEGIAPIPDRVVAVEQSLKDLERRVGFLAEKLAVLQPASADETNADVPQLQREWRADLQKVQTLLTIDQIVPWDGVKWENILTLSKFVYHEVAVRFAHRGKELAKLPYGLSDLPTIIVIRKWYFTSYASLKRIKEPSNIEECVELLKVLRMILERHARTLEQLAKGIYELRIRNRSSAENNPQLFQTQLKEGKRKKKKGGGFQPKWWGSAFPKLQDFLDNFNSTRIRVRFLIAHMVEMMLQVGARHDKAGFRYSQYGLNPQSYIGLVCVDMDPTVVVQQAISVVTRESNKYYQCTPNIHVESFVARNIVHVPHYICTIMCELLKNSIRAVIETHGKEGAKKGKKITVTVCVSEDQNLSIRVSDEGGGIKRSLEPLALNYLFTNATTLIYLDPFKSIPTNSPYDVISGSGSTTAAFAGYGYGLPISRAIAEFFGGSLELVSQEQNSTDVFVTLPNIRNGVERY